MADRTRERDPLRRDPDGSVDLQLPAVLQRITEAACALVDA